MVSGELRHVPAQLETPAPHDRKYKDANLLGDVDDAVEDGALDTSTSTTSVTMETQLAFPQDSVEEIDTGEIMR